MKEENISNEIKPATSSTLTKSRRTTISKLAKNMAFLFSIYHVCFRNLAKEHGFGSAKELSMNVYFVLTDATTYMRVKRMITRIGTCSVRTI